MITYTHKCDFFSFMRLLLQTKGSVFPRSCITALPCATAALVLKLLMVSNNAPFLSDAIFNQSSIWSGFSFLVAFLVVFRTSQSYSRFWEGCTSMHKMGMKWFNACSLVISFCKTSKADDKTTIAFKHTIMRLFSLLHAVALADIEDKENTASLSDVHAFKYEVFDVQSLDSKFLIAVKQSPAKVELVYQWLQQLIVLNIETNVLTVPPPILTRAFQEMANGMVEYHEARKISKIPFPFPYAQTCDWLLLLHMLLTPFVLCQWVNGLVWVTLYSFVQVFIFWSLRNIAVQIENPFGTDDTDLDASDAQAELNRNLEMMLSQEYETTPPCVPITSLKHVGNTLSHLWHTLGDLEFSHESDSDDPKHCKNVMSGIIGHKKKRVKKKKKSIGGIVKNQQQQTLETDDRSQHEGRDANGEDHRCIEIQISSSEIPKDAAKNSAKEALNHHSGGSSYMKSLIQAMCATGASRNSYS